MKVIEFFGMPRAGKTEQIQKLTSYLSDRGLSFTIITDREVEKEINVPVESAFDYNLLFFNKILEKLVSTKYVKNSDIVILDRGFIDAPVWFDVEHAQNNLSDEEKSLAQLYFNFLTRQIDSGIFMMVDHETSLKRHENKQETGKADDYVFSNYLEKLYRQYDLLSSKLSGEKKILVVDGKESVDAIHEKIINKLKMDNIIP